MAHTHFAELLDLDAEVLSDYHATVFAWVGATAPDRPHVLDLGAGTGIGSLSLARALPGATVTALDVDEEMLGHLRHKAEAAGLADRIRTVRADLDQPWPDLGGPADLIWASASMHHMADPGAALSRAYAALRPGGVLAVTELDAFPLFLPATDPHSALERRAHEAMAAMRDEAGLHMHEDWAARLKAAGFDPVEERRFDIALEPPLPAAGGRYAQLSLERMSHGLAERMSHGPAERMSHGPAERLSPADVASQAAVAAAVPQRDDLVVRAKRMVYLARR